MYEPIIYLGLVLFGLVLGSFAGATVWRLRAKQLAFDKDNDEPYNKAEYKHLKKLLHKKGRHDRSQCLHCGYTLRWYDLIPLVSWLALRGKCRACHTSIGRFEPIIEVSVAAFFVLSYVWWPFELTGSLAIVHFLLWLIAGVIMAVLFVYDVKWFILPDRYTLALALVGIGMVVVGATQSQLWGEAILNAVGAVAILGGLYGVLYFISGGRWVGFGDVKLGVGLGLLLGDWQLAAVALFLANFIGCLIVIPALITKKMNRTSRVPFGPLLISGTVIAFLWGTPLLQWYLGSMGIV
ncbi:MAG: A24 family peptidase [Candidatus Microsaccharimonas sp.]